MPLPDFLVAGAQKSGTTSLQQMMSHHPEIFTSIPKELHYFDRHYQRGQEWYESQFSEQAGRTSAHKVAGEATPFYMYSKSARERMLADLPHVRLICVLRNPIDRAYSHYWHSREKGPEKCETFEEALAREPERIVKSVDGQPRAFSYVDRGRYIHQVRALEEGVGQDRLCVLLMDDLTDNPVVTLERVFGFLAVAEAPAQEMSLVAANTYGLGEAGRQGEARDRPRRDRGELPSGPYPPMDAETRSMLRSTYADDNRALAQWLGRDLSHWG